MTIISIPEIAVKILLNQLYSEPTVEERMRERNAEIRRLFAIGMAKTEIGRRFGISARRVGQVIDEGNE